MASPTQKLENAQAALLAHQQRNPDDLPGIARLRRRVQRARREVEAQQERRAA